MLMLRGVTLLLIFSVMLSLCCAVVDVDVAVRSRRWEDTMRNLMRRRPSELHNVVRWTMYLIEYVLCSETNRWMFDSSMPGRCGVVDVLLLGVMQVQLYGCVGLRLRWEEERAAVQR
jgi:hypothetical protein